MRGRIIKRSKDSYTLIFDVGRDPTTGKRKQQYVTIRGNKKEAEAKLAELLHQVENGMYVKGDKSTFGEFCERWLREYAIPGLSPRTSEGYANIIKVHLKPSLGAIPLSALRPEHLQRYYAGLLENGLSTRTIQHHHRLIHVALQTACKWQILPRNVADAATPPRCSRSEMHILNEDDIRHVLDAAKDTPYFVFFFMAIYTGARRSELLGLKWADCDLLGCQVSINRSLHHLLDGSTVVCPPKTERGRRTIAISPSCALVLREHWGKQVLERRMLDIPVSNDDYVFSKASSNNIPMLANTITHAWEKLVKKLDINVPLHGCRHTHASMLLGAGVSIKTISERLGHSSASLTLDVYSHVIKGQQEQAAVKFDELVNYHPEK